MIENSIPAIDYTYRATLLRVVDGDTVDLRVDLGFHASMDLRFRILGIDAPEIRGPEKEEGAKATERLSRLLEEPNSTASRCYVRSVKTGKFGRWLGTVWNHEGVDVGATLVAEGLAKEYRG